MSQIYRPEYRNIFLAKEICRRSKVPEHSARKGLQLLVQGGILKAAPGPGGGYEFKIHPGKVSLLKIVDIFDGDEAYQKCIMGLHSCSSRSPCAMHMTWVDLRERLIKELRDRTLFDLMKRTKA